MKIFNTKADLVAASLTAGQLTSTKGYTTAGDGGGATYLIKTAVDYAGTPDEYGDHTLAGGTIAVLQTEGSVNVKQFGATGDGVADDTAAIQAALGGLPAIPADVFTDYAERVVYFPQGVYRITDTIKHPSNCKVIGDNPTSLQGLISGTIATEKRAIIYADFTYGVDSGGKQWTKKSAWTISGYSKNVALAPVDTYLDPYLYNMNGAAYDAGQYTRNYNCKLEGLHFWTDKNVACGVSVAGHPNIQVSVTCTGFLVGLLGQAVWGSAFEIKGQNYHCGAFFTQANGAKADVYLNGFTSTPANVPVIDSSTIPPQWHEDTNVGHETADKYLSTGVYLEFCSAMTFSNLIAEYYDRGLCAWNSSLGGVAYFEGLNNYGIQAISTNADFSTILMNLSGADGLLKTNDSSIVNVSTITNNDSVNIIAKGVSTNGIRHNIGMSLAYLSDTEAYWGDALFTSNATTIYVSSTGDDSYTGLTQGNAVLTVRRAIERCVAYGINSIEIKSGETVEFEDALNLNSFSKLNITITSDGTGKIQFTTTGANCNSTILTNSSLVFDGVLLELVNNGTPSNDYKGHLVGIGSLDVTLVNSSSLTEINTAGQTALFGGLRSESGIINFTLRDSTINVTVIAYNGSQAGGNNYRYFYGLDNDSTASGSQIWDAKYTVL